LNRLHPCLRAVDDHDELFRRAAALGDAQFDEQRASVTSASPLRLQT
jgi:hypothetical protein